MKLQQPRNYDFRVSQFDPPRSQSGNDRETTTKVATTVKRRLLHLAIIEAQMITLTTTAKLQQLRVNSREMTTFAASCNDREMQRPRSDKLETAQLLQILRKILCRFMAVVVSSAFWKSLRMCVFLLGWYLWDPDCLAEGPSSWNAPKIDKRTASKPLKKLIDTLIGTKILPN